ncbi:BTAD domain-containing putative transcriptional regulator [Mycolicibacterium arseniciresistens]|uniref:BTAD domain-containing putative transcriptional regulator n=1 Tax=Mycolicibacterium arseniciresistens TaxID=3062257 RepID=A0ABT8UFQ1_9MYCO|nr:BTAD domain-containing putative transcriptional regulator [Mycolicibacterium arseniciresistens]MDO3635009.1 BTAD domain-containing putative transcriptional regulator [Mycolicibacterium arseniciresistens]
MHYRLLGPLQVVRAGAPVELGPPKQRAVLAVLLLAHGRVVSVDRLVDAVWGDDAPGSATAGLQAYISNLRRALRDDPQASPIVRQPPGYFLDIDADSVDLAVFARRCAEVAGAVEAADWTAALDVADAAMALWRGPFLADLSDQPWVAQDAARVEVMRADCLDKRITALLALGRVSQALAAVSELRAADPLGERGCWLHMLALYRAGRAPDALEAYGGYARLLDAELGLQPGAELRDLQTAILRQSPELAAWPRHPEWTGAGEVATPVAAHVVLDGPTASSSRGQLVGRGREMTAAAGILTDVSAGATRWLVLSGPPGIGKTRLAEELAAQVDGAGGDVVWVGCPDERTTPPWWPMRQLVRALGADADEVLEVPPNADPDTARFRVYERVQSLLEGVSRTLAVVIDDVQWADSTSAACLAYIAGALRDHPVAVIVTVRDGEHSAEVARLLATVARGDRNRHIAVPALSARDVVDLANQVADDVVTDAEATVLADRTGGNPFFVCEYARLPRAERVGTEIPLAVKSVLHRRFAALDPAVISVLRTAAVIGDVLDVDAMRVLAEATGLDMDTLADHLDEAADERIIVTAHSGDGYSFAHGLLREQLLADMPALRRQRLHAEIADVLRDTDSGDAVTRRARHLMAAQPQVEPGEVVRACRRAAEEATARWSSDIAAGWWQSALSAYDRLPASARTDDERDALTVALLEAHSRAGRGRLVLDTVERNLTEAVRAGNAVTAGRVASALLRATGGWPWLAPGHDPGALLALLERAAAIAQSSPAAGARVLAALAVGHCYHPDTAVAAGHLDRAQELADRTGDPEVLADVLMGRLITYSGVAPLSRQTLEWVAQLNSMRHSRSHEDSVIAHSVATMAAMNLADVDGAAAHLKAGIEGSEQLQLPVLRAQLRWMEAVIAVWRGDFAEAKRHHGIAAHVHEQTELYEAGSGLVAAVSLLREKGGPVGDDWPGLRASPETGGQGMVGLVHTALLTVDHRRESRAAALARLQEWRAASSRAHVWTALGHQTLLAHLAADHCLDEFAAPLVAVLEPFADRIAVIGQVGSAGPVALATARLHALLGDRGLALAALAQARDIAARTGGTPSLVRCRLLECELDQPGPQRSAAAREVAEQARRLGMRAVAEAADRLA